MTDQNIISGFEEQLELFNPTTKQKLISMINPDKLKFPEPVENKSNN
jgi:hypothetical protein